MQSNPWTRSRLTRRRLLAVLFLASLISPVMVNAASAGTSFLPADIYRNSSSSVVLIFGFSDSGAGSSGTGSILTLDGLVLTNSHVITNAENGRVFPNLVVYFKPKPISGDNRKDLTTPFLVDVLARDADLDLALLRIKDAPSDLRPIEIADSEEVDIGEPVAAIGHPGGLQPRAAELPQGAVLRRQEQRIFVCVPQPRQRLTQLRQPQPDRRQRRLSDQRVRDGGRLGSGSDADRAHSRGAGVVLPARDETIW